MIIENEKPLAVSNKPRRLWPWLNAALSAVLLSGGVWYIVTQTTLDKIGQALALANGGFILLGLGSMLLTLLLKSWRWQLLLAPTGKRPSYPAVFWAIMLGQFANLMIPFLRLGEIARIFALHRQSGWSRGAALGTLVVEKSVELIMLAVSITILIPLVALPESIRNPGTALGTTAVILLIVLYFLTFQTSRIIFLSQLAAKRLPGRIGGWLLRLLFSGLTGLEALRHRRTIVLLFCQSTLITTLAIMTPLLLFKAFNLPFGFPEAIMVNAAGSVVQIPPSTPVKIGVFETAIFFLLKSVWGAEEAVALSYAVILHVIIVLPQVLFGSIAAHRTGWHWQADSPFLPEQGGLK